MCHISGVDAELSAGANLFVSGPHRRPGTLTQLGSAAQATAAIQNSALGLGVGVTSSGRGW